MSILQQCNKESARIFAPMAKKIARERRISLEKTAPEKTAPEKNDSLFLRELMFAKMLEGIHEGGEMLPPEKFNAIFDVSPEKAEKTVGKKLREILSELEGIAKKHGIKLK